MAAYEQLKEGFAASLVEHRADIAEFKRSYPKLTDEKALDFFCRGSATRKNVS